MAILGRIDRQIDGIWIRGFHTSNSLARVSTAPIGIRTTAACWAR